MIRKIVGLFGLMILMAISTVGAQDAPTWYWAMTVNETTGEHGLAAYTIDGETTTLVENAPLSELGRLWRLSPESALGFFEGDDAVEVYHLTSTSASEITLPEGMETADSWVVYAQSGNYVMAANFSGMPSGPAVVINVATLTAQALPADAVAPPYGRSVAFSRDGSYLRYTGANEQRWSIREYKLETGDEREIAYLEDIIMSITAADTYGEHWLHAGRERRLIAADGTVLETFVLSREQPIAYNIFGEDLVSFDSLCTENCVIEVESFATGETRTFTLPIAESFPQPYAKIDDQRMLFLVDNAFWLLNTDGSGELLGYYMPQTMSQSLQYLLSPDRRYLLVLADPDMPIYSVVDLETGEALFESDPEDEYHIIQINYTADGFILTQDLLRFWFYRYADGNLTELLERQTYIDQVGDAVIQAERRPSEGLSINRYDLNSGESTPILTDAIPLFASELPPLP